MATKPRGSSLIQISVDKKSVDHMLRLVEARTSPAGVAVWLDQFADPIVRKRAEERFQSEGDDVVGAWLPLKPFTQALRASQGYGAAHPINRRTGELEDYVTHARGDVTMTAIGATLTSPDPSSVTPRLHDKIETAQLGSPFPNTPARPVMGLNGNDLVLQLLSLSKFVVGGTP